MFFIVIFLTLDIKGTFHNLQRHHHHHHPLTKLKSRFSGNQNLQPISRSVSQSYQLEILKSFLQSCLIIPNFLLGLESDYNGDSYGDFLEGWNVH